MIESGYQADIGSHAGAVGLWQFMPATARRYGLRVDGRLDDRTDPRRSTQKAAEYLNDLAQEFGAEELMLVLAGYNKGENGIRAKLREGDDPFEDRSYWHLVETNRLPAETALYVARFVAAGVAGEGGLPTEESLEAAGFKSP
jgi:membrane-bound lytic murein transglycosylase D